MADASVPRWLTALVVGGIAIRVLLRLVGGEDAFVSDGYEFNLTLSRSFLNGDGFCYAPGEGCAIRVPVYPLLLAAFIAAGALYPGVVVVQAVLGGAIAWLAWLIGCELFNRRVGAAAAVATALSPYALVHDTALQDTVLVNFLMTASLLLLLVARRTAAAPTWVAAGAVLGLAVLTSARVLLFVPLALGWVLLAGGDRWKVRLRHAVMLAVPIVVLLGGWTLRNWRVVGAPVLTTEAGESLWFGNNPWTFAHFPARSIDLTSGEFDQLPAADRAALEGLAEREADRDALLGAMARDYIVADPGRAVAAAARKIWVAVSAQFSPARGALVQLGYLAVYLPVHLLALAGFWRARTRWVAHGPAWLLVVSFLVTTAVFWAHTSHKTYLDPVLFVYAAAALL